MREPPVVRRVLPLLLLFALAFAPAGAQTSNDTANETPVEEEAPETPAEPAGPPTVAIALLGYQEGSSFYFQIEGETQRNPDLVVPPGAEVTVTFRSVAGVHNFHPDGMAASDFVADGETTTYTFTAPQSGTIDYWCDPHKGSGMRGKIVVQAAGGAPAAPAAPAAPTEYTLLAVQEGSSFYFQIEGETQRNPQLLVPAGATITITLKSVAGVHNIHVDGQAASAFVADGETTTYTFTAPASGTVEYWCDPHKGSGMKSVVKVATAGEPGGDGGGALPGDCEIPSASEAGYVGGPTVADYQAMCAGTAGPVTKEDPYEFADFIIPTFWGLIGIGVVGAVWVHKKYHP